jgi:hypothetical protein
MTVCKRMIGGVNNSDSTRSICSRGQFAFFERTCNEVRTWDRNTFVSGKMKWPFGNNRWEAPDTGRVLSRGE